MADKEWLARFLRATFELYPNMPRISRDAFELWWAALARYSDADVRAAFDAHVRDPAVGAHPPKPADIIRHLQVHDGWIGPNEAWSIVAPSLNDESVTVVWTQPMQQAFGRALDLRDDPIAARKAFIETYEHAVADARRQGFGPVWQPSLGTNAEARDAAIEEAVRIGRMRADHAVKLMSGKSAAISARVQELLPDKS